MLQYFFTMYVQSNSEHNKGFLQGHISKHSGAANETILPREALAEWTVQSLHLQEEPKTWATVPAKWQMMRVIGFIKIDCLNIEKIIHQNHQQFAACLLTREVVQYFSSDDKHEDHFWISIQSVTAFTVQALFFYPEAERIYCLHAGSISISLHSLFLFNNINLSEWRQKKGTRSAVC